MLLKYIEEKMIVVLFYLFRIFPIKKNKIVISNYLGQGYGDNAKYIVEEISKHKEKYDIVWLLKDVNNYVPQYVRKVNYSSIKAIYEQVTAKIWIDNRRKPNYVRKRKNQYYIMTWHGGLGLKRVEGDAENSLSSRYISAAKNDSKMANLLLSNSKFTDVQYKRAFWYQGEVARFGLPREDILFDNSKLDINKVKDQLGVSADIKIALYAPTFRNADIETYVDLYSLKWDTILEKLKEKFGGEWVGAIRLHPNISSYANKLNIPKNVVNASYYPDMQELLVASDCLITDYSSSMFDYGIMKKPVFLIAKDVDEYVKDRNFYFDIESLPFIYTTTEKALLCAIENFDSTVYISEIDAFYKKVGLIPAGNASEGVAKIINSVCYKK